MKTTAAVTICSLNYISRALVLFESYKQHHPEHSFYIVLVDRKTTDVEISKPDLTIMWAEDLPIPGFLQYAFAFDIIELNTNVKPTVLKSLLVKHDLVIYLDPDIAIFSPLSPVLETLEHSPIVVTPHSTTPILDGNKPDDLEFLRFGAFNLGFIGVARSQEAIAFLEWWSVRCLEYGFYEPQLGLAVDQKWVNLAPAYFPGLRVLRHLGLNVAFWNLHERQLSCVNGKWIVNNDTPLIFVHFSSFDADSSGVVAKKQNRFAPGSRTDFSLLASGYASLLAAENFKSFESRTYGYDYFDDGAHITPALRRFYAAFRKNVFSGVTNPFDSTGRVRAFAKANGLVLPANSVAKRQIFKDVGAYKTQIWFILKILRFTLFVLGPNRYFALMRYLAHISSLRNQSEMFGKVS